jgi:hypothetical protein
MKIRILPKTLCARIAVALLLAVGVSGLPASAQPILVDGYTGGSIYVNSPFRGMLGVTPVYQELGGIFVPNTTSYLTTIDVSIFVQPDTTGSAYMTIFRYDQTSPGISLTLGPNLGYAVAPQASYSGLVPFDFSSQNIELIAGQSYAFMLSNPDATSFEGFGNSWRMNCFTGAPRMTINSSSTYSWFHYYTASLGYGAQYEVYATPVPEPGLGSLLALCLVTGSLRRAIYRSRRPH